MKYDVELVTRKKAEKDPNHLVLHLELDEGQRVSIRGRLIEQLAAGCLQVRLRMGEYYIYMTRKTADWMARQMFFVKEVDCFYSMDWYLVPFKWTEARERNLHQKYLDLKAQAEQKAEFYQKQREMFGQPEIVGYSNDDKLVV